ncbi:ribonuclease 3-like [Babylonia areolata]|uniref:ribonuclease 3-like n=1 Tax=Babylonia areolata TaxID=304850 RepID=UPI003FD2795B
MYNRRGNQHYVGPRGMHPGQGGGRGNVGGNLPMFHQQQQQGMAGRQGVHGGTMLGMHSGTNLTLNPANRGPPGISAAATALRVNAAGLGRNSAASLMHSQQLPQNLTSSVAGRLIASQIQHKQQLQQLQIQQQNLRQNQLHLLHQQRNMRQNELQLQQRQQNILHLQQHPLRPGLASNLLTPSEHPMSTPRLPANSLSHSGPGHTPMLQPPASQGFDGPGRRGESAVSRQRAGNIQGQEGWQEPHPNNMDRSQSQKRESRSAASNPGCDRDSRAGRREDHSRKTPAFSQDSSRKTPAFSQDSSRKTPAFSQDSRRHTVSPDTQAHCSYNGTSHSHSSSNRTDTESNSRGTSASRESGSYSQRSQRPDAERDRNDRYMSSRSSRYRQKEGNDREFEKSAGKGREGDKDSYRSQRSASTSTQRRPREETDDVKDRLSCEDKPRALIKRKCEDNKDGEKEMKLDNRDWPRGVKRLRPDSREAKADKEAAVSATPKDSTPSWIRCSPADLYFTRDADGVVQGTPKMTELEELFQQELIERGEKERAAMPKLDPPTQPAVPCIHNHHHHHHGSGDCSSSSSSGDSSSSDTDSDSEEEMCTKWMEEMERKRNHPSRMHSELWGNDPGEMNNGPLCRCSIKARRSGIRHDIYPGEKFLEPCPPSSNNLNHLHHYRITMAPSTNFLSNSPTVIEFDNHEFIFEGFSLFTHEKLETVPLCKVIRFHIEYTIHFLEEPAPENFTVCSLDLFTKFLFTEVLELVDLDWKGFGGGCNRFHLLPRFARSLPENGKEVLSMNEVLKYLLDSSRPLVDEKDLPQIRQMDREAWQSWVEVVCGMIVTFPGKKPSSVRVDQLDRTKLMEEEEGKGKDTLPILVHFGIRPAQLCYAGNPAYQKAWKQYIKLKHLLNSKPKVLAEDKEKLKAKEAELQEIQAKSTMKREVTVEMSTRGFFRTGLKSDICQHALLLPVLMSHIRFHHCLNVLEQHMNYAFKDRALLQLALTHTSFRNNYGTNSAHARNSLTNCGLRQVEYGDHRVYYQNTRKRGINILVDIMSRLGRKEEVVSEVPHNERLEFLGDAVVEFLSSVHLFFMFHWLEEGGLSTYRTALVQNQHLSLLAKTLHLQDFMLYVHGPDLCHESDLRHAMANCFEALMGALFLDGGLETVDAIFGRTLFGDEAECLKIWQNLPLHPLQEDEPAGDRHWVESSPALQKLITFEESTGLTFSHIRILAKAFTHRSVGSDNLLTMGHNQRLEFLGDTVLQLIASEYLYRHFPEHHEGHLSLLRSSLVNSRTQSIVCDDLGMTNYVIYEKGNERGNDTAEMKTKQKADLLEAFLGALYVDSGMEACTLFCDVCFFPRLKDFILNQDWNDPKSQLQQCCLTLRKMGAGEPDIPFYKVIESLGPSNTRKYVVAVYFRGERLATGTGHSIQQAEMSAATNALKIRSELFPILQHQRRFLDRRQKQVESRKPRQYRTLPTAQPRKPRAENRTSRTQKPSSSSSRPSKNSRPPPASSSLGPGHSRHRRDSRDSRSVDSRDSRSLDSRSVDSRDSRSLDSRSVDSRDSRSLDSRSRKSTGSGGRRPMPSKSGRGNSQSCGSSMRSPFPSPGSNLAGSGSGSFTRSMSRSSSSSSVSGMGRLPSAGGCLESSTRLQPSDACPAPRSDGSGVTT